MERKNYVFRSYYSNDAIEKVINDLLSIRKFKSRSACIRYALKELHKQLCSDRK